MSQSNSVDLALARAVPSDPAQAEIGRARAADLVDDFVRQRALPALEAALEAAEADQPPADGLARDAVETAAMLADEVGRFRRLAPDPTVFTR